MWFAPACFVAVAALVFVVAWISFVHMPLAGIPTDARAFAFPNRPWLDTAARWDSWWYLAVAMFGYWYIPGQASAISFFPLYPSLMRLGHWMGADPLLAGVLITLICGAAAAVLLYRWTARVFSPRVAAIAVAFFLLYPYSYYLYGVVYADALYIAFALAAFTLLEEGRPVLAGLAGACATATRPVGVFLLAGLALRALQLRGWTLSSLRARDLGVLLSGGGAGAYLFYLWMRFGKPTAFMSASGASGWAQGQTAPQIWAKVGFVHMFARPKFDANHFTVGLQAALVVTALALSVVVTRRLGVAYGAYSLGTVAVPAFFSHNFVGTGRYSERMPSGAWAFYYYLS